MKRVLYVVTFAFAMSLLPGFPLMTFADELALDEGTPGEVAIDDGASCVVLETETVTAGQELIASPAERRVHLLETKLGDQAAIVWMSSQCEVRVTCPGGPVISCTGTVPNCAVATKSCPDGGSTCPDQGASVSAVRCDGVIQAQCPCPEVCFGCGATCNDDWDCFAACTCAPGFCDSGQCLCPY